MNVVDRSSTAGVDSRGFWVDGFSWIWDSYGGGRHGVTKRCCGCSEVGYGGGGLQKPGICRECWDCGRWDIADVE